MSPLPLVPLLLVAAVPAGGDWFYPGRGDRVAVVAPDEGGLRVGGMAVERSGNLLARARDSQSARALAALPEVAWARPLGGDGLVLRLHPREGTDEIALSRALHGRPEVVWSHPDFLVEAKAAALPNDPFVRDQWHLSNIGQRGWTPGVDINAELAWTRTTGAGALVAVIDTGVQSTHPDLKVTVGYDYVDGDMDSNPVVKVDGAPHGTAVAGIISAIGNNAIGVAGVAYAGDIYGIRMIGGKTSLGDFYSAFVEAVDAGAWVLSNSWGYGDKCDPVEDFSVYDDSIAYAETMGRGGLGAAIVFAAGNGNCDIGNNQMLGHPEMVVVAATNGDDRREGYSCFGKFVAVAAPSGTILTTDLVGADGYGSWKGDPDYSGDFSGTSAATPVVSGAIALMFASNPRLTAAQARAVLRETAAKVDIANAGYDETGFSPYYGFGRLDAGAAVMAVANGAPAAPVVVAPIGLAYADRVVLHWQPSADPDGDLLSYKVTWRLDPGGADNVVMVEGGATHLDITKQVAVGQRIVWGVQAYDLWGAGGASPSITFSVEQHPVAPTLPPAQGCSCRVSSRPTAAPWGITALALLALALRTRQRRR